MKSITIIYGSNTGSTEKVANSIKDKLSGTCSVRMVDVAKASQKDLEESSNLILGTSTWNFGDIQDDWETFLPVLKRSTLNDKTVALFGVGDGYSYGDTFVDGIGTIYQAVKDKNCKIVGRVSDQGYEYTASTAFDGNEFVGLPIDEDNEPDQTDARIDNWLKTLTPHFC